MEHESESLRALGLLALGEYWKDHDVMIDPSHLPAGEPYEAIRAARAALWEYRKEKLTPNETFNLAVHDVLPRHPEFRQQLRILREAVEAARPTARAAYTTYLKNRAPVHELNTVRWEKAQALAPQLLTVPGVRSVYLFGSVARGQDTETSDIDLYVHITGLWKKMWRNIGNLVRQALPTDSTVPEITHVLWKDEQFQVMAGTLTPTRKGLLDSVLLTSSDPATAFAAHRTHPEVWTSSTDSLWLPLAWDTVLNAIDYRGVGEWWNGQRILPFQWMVRYPQGVDRPSMGIVQFLNKTLSVPETLWDSLASMSRPSSAALEPILQSLLAGEQRQF